MRHPECHRLQIDAESVLAGGPGTFSKASTRYPEGAAPYALVSGEGAYVTGSNGRLYLDTVAALGAVVLGHSHPAVVEAVCAQAQRGASFSMVHPLEISVAQTLCAMLPCAEMVRFARNGTDVTNMAVRLARAITGKKHVIFLGYHGGGADAYAITTDKRAGVLEALAPYNHQATWGTLETIPPAAWKDLACLMTEVPALAWGRPADEYTRQLRALQHEAHSVGALFVLDEVVTFPRWGVSGAQGLYGVIPDLTCVSKGLANGFPLAALAGQRQYMERLNDGDIFASSTFAGETTALAAATATLRCMRDTDAVARIWRYGQVLGEGLQALAQQHAVPMTVFGHPPRLGIRWPSVELRTLWLQEMAKRGVLWGIGVCFPMACWGADETACLLKAAAQTCALMARAIAKDRVAQAITCPLITDVLTVRA